MSEVRNTDDLTKLPEEHHHNVAKLLFISNFARCKIQTPVAFLTTTEKNADEDDWGKLKQISKYINETKNLC